jgi:lipase maturation factor 1
VFSCNLLLVTAILQNIRSIEKREMFLRGMAFVYFIAFASLAVQILGLVGSEGILPGIEFLKQIGSEYGWRAYYMAPTVFWLNAGDVALASVCFLGAIISLVMFIGFLPNRFRTWAWAVLWIFYLSLVTIGQEFMTFQWDTLLLEAGWITFLFSATKHSELTVFLFRLLVFRLFFLSGVVKLLSGDPAWRDLTALTYHFETQPLPTLVAPYLHFLPLTFHKFCAGVMFGIELILPFFIFLNWEWRFLSFRGFILLQLLIALSGNYGFFNILTVVLCLTLLPEFDQYTPFEFQKDRFRIKKTLAQTWIGVAIIIMAIRLVALGVGWRSMAEPIRQFVSIAEPYYIANGYGLFAVMTTVRREIVLEASDDMQSWHEYSFRWKPVDITQPPSFVAPHQPRLDWLFWFAALSDYSKTPWIQHFFHKILQGKKPVLALLSNDASTDSSPKYLRAIIYEYRFSQPSFPGTNSTWWERKNRLSYSPVLTLR